MVAILEGNRVQYNSERRPLGNQSTKVFENDHVGSEIFYRFFFSAMAITLACIASIVVKYNSENEILTTIPANFGPNKRGFRGRDKNRNYYS